LVQYRRLSGKHGAVVHAGGATVPDLVAEGVRQVRGDGAWTQPFGRDDGYRSGLKYV
jgi:hypothetical protein